MTIIMGANADAGLTVSKMGMTERTPININHILLI